MSSVPVSLRRMLEADFNAYMSRALPLLAAAQSSAYRMTLEDARSSAEAAFDKIEPAAEPGASGQHLYIVVAGEVEVGAIWFEVRQSGGGCYAYLYDWIIWPEYRGKGLGKAALVAVEQAVQKQGCSRLMLNVFAHNRFAYDLYRRYGFAVGSSILVKQLQSGPTKE